MQNETIKHKTLHKTFQYLLVDLALVPHDGLDELQVVVAQVVQPEAIRRLSHVAKPDRHLTRSMYNTQLANMSFEKSLISQLRYILRTEYIIQ